MIGIYKILNKKNNKFYIGQSMNIFKRWQGRKDSLKANRHVNYRLQKDWNKFPNDSFELIVIKECDSHLLLYYESYYIRKLKAIAKGYNLRWPPYYTISPDQIDFIKKRLMKFASKLKHDQLITTNAIVNKFNITQADISLVLASITFKEEEKYNTKLQFLNGFRKYIKKINLEMQQNIFDDKLQTFYL